MKWQSIFDKGDSQTQKQASKQASTKDEEDR